MGILPGHIPLMTQVGAGELRATKGDVTELLIVGGGFAQVTAEKVSILADSAIEEEKIDVNAVEEAMKRAEDALKGEADLTPAEIERLEGDRPVLRRPAHCKAPAVKWGTVRVGLHGPRRLDA